jgi:monomeric isocitrate dehydrogenase
MKTTMMKVSDPIIFFSGAAVDFAIVFLKYAATLFR